MSHSSQSFLSRYREAIRFLDAYDASLTKEQALSILSARDEIHAWLEQQTSTSAYILQTIEELDLKLLQHRRRIIKALDLSFYRKSLMRGSTRSWWWNLDKPNVRDRYNWILETLTIGSWVAILSLLLNIGDRFFREGLGLIGAFGVILPSLIALLKARSDLKDENQEIINKFLDFLRIPRTWRTETKLISTLLVLIFILMLWLSLPSISSLYNRWGLSLYSREQLSQAEQKFRQAISLDDKQAEAHYNLGLIYEDWLRFDEAKNAYQIAVSQGVIEAYNNLARLLLKEGDNQRAIILLQEGLFLGKRKPLAPEDEFNLYKNLGWARLLEGDFSAAESALVKALQISASDSVSQAIRSQAAAYCLLAQVFEGQGKTQESLEAWQECCKLGIERLRQRREPIFEEDEWLQRSNEKLRTIGKNCPSPDTTL